MCLVAPPPPSFSPAANNFYLREMYFYIIHPDSNIFLLTPFPLKRKIILIYKGVGVPLIIFFI